MPAPAGIRCDRDKVPGSRFRGGERILLQRWCHTDSPVKQPMATADLALTCVIARIVGGAGYAGLPFSLTARMRAWPRPAAQPSFMGAHLAMRGASRRATSDDFCPRGRASGRAREALLPVAGPLSQPFVPAAPANLMPRRYFFCSDFSMSWLFLSISCASLSSSSSASLESFSAASGLTHSELPASSSLTYWALLSRVRVHNT